MAEPGEAILYPIFLKLHERSVLVVGAGDVAERKVLWLIEARARVRVVAPVATARIRLLAEERTIEWVERTFEDADAEGVWLLVAATSDAAVQQRVAAAGQAHRTFVVAVDDPKHASAYSGAVVRRPPFTVAISSSGATPALTRLVREVIELVLPPDEWIEHAKMLREKWTTERVPMGERFGDLVRELATKRE
jgi:siroheme synthase-like protein